MLRYLSFLLLFVGSIHGLQCYYCDDNASGNYILGIGIETSCSVPFDQMLNGTCPVDCLKEVHEDGSVKRNCGFTMDGSKNLCFRELNDGGKTHACVCNDKDFCNSASRNGVLFSIATFLFAYFVVRT